MTRKKINVDTTKELTHLSLCAGYGGIDLGLSRALGAVSTVCFVEIEAFVIENLVAKIEAGLLDTSPIFTDLKAFPWELYNGKVDILSGGFPCQPFSAAGRRKGSEDPRHLWPYITDGIKRLGRPPIVFFENVEGIISSKLKGDDWADPEGTSVLHHVLKELERLGYRATAGVFSAREVGAPHQRKRVFILGIRDDFGDSGRTVVSGLLERGGGEDLEHAQPSESSTAYPAPRGAAQYAWEPRRVTVGNAEHNGLSTPSERGSKLGHTCTSRSQNVSHEHRSDESEIKYKETVGSARSCASNRTGKLEAISFNRSERSLSESTARTKGSKLGNADGGDKGSHGVEFRILPTQDTNRQASGLEWTGDVGEGLDHTDQQRLLRDCDEPPNTNTERRENAVRHNAQAGTPPRGLQGETESTLGGDVNGVTCGLDYAKLSESCDNRTDELRLLGNGVVPATAERAFRTLWRALYQ